MLLRSLVLFVCFAVGAGFVARAQQPESPPARKTFADFPFQLDGWRGRQEPPMEPSILALLGVDDYMTRAYFQPGAGIGVYIGYYASQRQGDAIHSPQNCLPGAGWEPVTRSVLPLVVRDAPGAPDRQIQVNRFVIQKGIDRQLVLYWYQSHGRVVAGEYAAKFYLLRDAMRLNRTDAALVRVMTPFTGETGETAAEHLVTGFVQTLFPRLGQYIPS